MRELNNKALIVITCLLLFACQSSEPIVKKSTTNQPKLPEVDVSRFETQNVIDKDALFTLTPQQSTDFLLYFNSAKNSHLSEHERVSNFLQRKLNSFSFLGRTYTAKEALLNNEGNCLSLAMLTTALADLVDLDIRFQTVNSSPIYRRYANVTTTAGHVRTILLAKKKTKDEPSTLLRSRMIIDYFPSAGDVKGEFISRDDFTAMYFQNLASEALVEENYNLAFSYIQKALQLNHLNPHSLNTYAVLLNQVGLSEAAASIYEYGVQFTPRTVNLIWNYANLLKARGEGEKASSLLADIDANKDTNPYSWLDIANEHFQNDNYWLATKYYRKTTKLAPYLHEAYFGLAKVQYLQGYENKAMESLLKAKDLAYEDETKRLYNAKSATLRLALTQSK